MVDRMEETRARTSVPSSRLGELCPLHVAGGHAEGRAAPVRAELVALAPDASADNAFEAVLALYAPAIGENLRCVLSETDPEGAHQLRVTLRRLRAALKIFKPVIRSAVNKRLAWMSRYIGAIVGELRDADVMIEEMLRPAASADTGDALGALETWRQEVRAKVRESLRAARAAGFANDLILLSQNCGWRVKAKRPGRPGPNSARVLVNDAIEALRARASAYGRRTALLSPAERHEFRKHIKALRYAVELTASYDPDAAALLIQLKRLQTVLGQLNDMHTFQSFEPALANAEALYAAWRLQLIETHAQRTPKVVAHAVARWRALVAAGCFSEAAMLGA